MEREGINQLRTLDSTIKKMYIEALLEAERENTTDARFTTILSQLDMNRLDYMAVTLNKKRVAVVRELLVSALYDVENILGYEGWELVPEEELIEDAQLAAEVPKKVLYASVVRGKISVEGLVVE